MRHLKILIALVFSLSLQPFAHATTRIVGSCRAPEHGFANITSAIAASQSGDEIHICPGTYAEQVIITKQLNVRGISIPHQPGVTITAPAAGLVEMPAGTGFYPQVYVYRAPGTVLLQNLAIDGTAANIRLSSFAIDTTSACQIGFLKDFSGIYFQAAAGSVENVSISGHFVSSFASDTPGPQQYPDCGTGIEFNNGTQASAVRNTVINGYGYTGISASGPLIANHNVLTTPSGPYQVGIQAPATAEIVRNTISGAAFVQSTGIHGGGLVEDNLVEGFSLGIVNAAQAHHNTLLNNYIGISEPGAATENLITNSVQHYIDPSCVGGACGPNPPYLPTVGIDVQCGDSSKVRINGFVGLGVGVANVNAGQTVASSNLFANVALSSTACTQ